MDGQVLMLSPAERHQGHVDLTKDTLYPGLIWPFLSNSGSGSGPGSGFSWPPSAAKFSGAGASGPGFGSCSPGTRSFSLSWASGEGFSVDWRSLVWAGGPGGPGGLGGWWRDKSMEDGERPAGGSTHMANRFCPND